MSEDHTDSEAEEEKDRRSYTVVRVSEVEIEEGTDEDENGTDRGQDEDADDDDEGEDEDYEEVVVKPRHLNEVTSLTDKTSPWTSMMSDPDMVSLESLEAPEEPDLNQDEEERRQVVNVEPHDSSGKHECTRQGESDSFNESAGDASDTETGGERTQQAEGPQSLNKGSGDTDPSPSILHATDTPDSSLDDQDSQLQPYPSSVFVDVCLPVTLVFAVLTSFRKPGQITDS